MSYNQGGYPPYGGPPPQGPPQGQYPPQGYPPQQGYGAPSGPQGYGQQQGYPPQGQFPQQSQAYPPQQQPGYPPQQQHNQVYPPQQGYQPQQNQGYPPQGQPPYGAPSHSPYPQQPQAPYGAPPHSPQPPYGAPQGAPYGAPAPVQHQQAPYGAPQSGPSAPYGAAPTQPYGAPSMPTPPTPGYAANQDVQYDASKRADELRGAMKGFGTNESVLTRNLAHIPAIELACLKSTYYQRHHRSLEKDIESETSRYFEDCLLSILRGPLQGDVYSLNKALKGAGTRESWLNDVLIGRSNADMHAIKQAYKASTRRDLEQDVRGDLSAKTERLFMMILSGTRQEDSAPVLPQAVDADVVELHRATEGKAGAEQLTVCSILSNRSDGHIRAIAHAYEAKYRRSLEKVIISEFSGHMEKTLVDMVRCGTDRAMRDAERLEECMKGPGTKDELLVARVVQMHWDKAHMAQVRGAYRVKYGKELVSRVRGETSGDYERCLVAMIE